MFYYWLIPILVLAIIAVGVFAYSSKRKSRSPALNEGESPEPVKRGRFINK